MGSTPILPEFQPVTIDTMWNILTGRISVQISESVSVNKAQDFLTGTFTTCKQTLNPSHCNFIIIKLFTVITVVDLDLVIIISSLTFIFVAGMGCINPIPMKTARFFYSMLLRNRHQNGVPFA